jgi:hypothetical protein
MIAAAPGGVATLAATDLFERTTVVIAAATAVASLVAPIVFETVIPTAVGTHIGPAAPFICRFGSSFVRRSWLGSATISLRLGLWIGEHQGEEEHECSGENQNEPAP